MSSASQHRSGPIAWMARNSVAANLLMAILLAGGLWMALTMQKEVFPQFQLDVVIATVEYPGAAPREVEQGILLPIEEAVRGIEGIKELTSTAEEGVGTVNIELVSGAERMQAFQEIDQAIARIRTFPEEIEEPQVRLQARQREVMVLGLYGDVDIWTLRKLAERFRDQLLNKGNVTQVELGDVPEYVTHVEIDQSALRQYNITLPQVAELIAQSSEDVPAGAVETHSGEILLRVKERKQWAEEFAKIKILANPDGAVVSLGDIATVTDGFQEEGFHAQFNRQPSVEILIYRTGEQSPLEIADTVQQAMDEFAAQLPPGVQWRIDSNNAQEYGERLNLLIENGLISVVIVFCVLALFLELSLAFWVMLGMATSFIGGLLFLPMLGVSLNMISMFGFLVVLGIVVDDAIVVGENVFERRKCGIDAHKAAVIGATAIAGPVVFSILTNVATFVPLLFIPGETGKFWWPLPVVVITVLVVSLCEALLILPAHLAHSNDRPPRNLLSRKIHKGQQAFARGFDRFVDKRYSPFLNLCLANRYITIVAAFALLVVAGSYALSSHMGMIMMPEVSADEIEAGVQLPVGTTPDRAAEVAQQLTDQTLRMFEEHQLDKVAEGVKTNVRGQNFIDVEIVMKPPDERKMTADELIAIWRDAIGEMTGVEQITFEAERGPGGYQQDISVDLSHSDFGVLERASNALVKRLERFSNTRDVNDNYNMGKTQIDFHLLPEGRALGLTSADVGEQLRAAFFGDLALRQLRGTNEVEVRVKLPDAQREDIYYLQDFVLRAPSGMRVPLLDVVRMEYGQAFTTINRRAGSRVVQVSTDVEPKSETNQVIATLKSEILPQLRQEFPGLSWSFQGTQADMRESTGALVGSFTFAILIIYALLAVAFSSYSQPLIVLFAIPFGIIGAVLGHILLGYDLSIVSLMGVVALSGVVVNDSLIMVDYANQQRQNSSAYEAIRQAGLRRFRPIILTTMTTFAGLTPILFETSMQAQYIIPMAISLGFGIVFSTSIILLLVPCVYMSLEDIKARSAHLFEKRPT